jgi:hypothetical protein
MESLCEAAGQNMIYLIIGACLLAGMVLRAITAIVKTQAREKSRREIAAYVAGGSITPEQAERLLRADASDRSAGGP